jgi:hypothetical protein
MPDFEDIPNNPLLVRFHHISLGFELSKVALRNNKNEALVFFFAHVSSSYFFFFCVVVMTLALASSFFSSHFLWLQLHVKILFAISIEAFYP